MISKLQRLFNELGFVNSVFYLLDRVIRKITFSTCCLVRYLLVAQPVALEPMLPSKRGSKFKVREISADDSIVSVFPVPKHVVDERFRQKARCLVAEKNGEFVGYLWLAYHQYKEDEVRATFCLPDKGRTVWDFDVYVEPKYRLGFAFMRLWDEAYALLRGQRVEWTYSRISAFNLSSKKSHSSLGAITLCHGTFIVFGPVQIMIVGCKPYLNVSVKKSPDILLPSTKGCGDFRV